MSQDKKLFVKSFGCQMNVYDSQRMADVLVAEGYKSTDTAEGADLVLLNTCHIREKAGEKVYSDLGRLKKLKAANPGMKIGVAGCVAQAEGEEIFRRMPIVDLVVGPQSYHRLPEMTRSVLAGARVADTEFPEESKFDHLPRRSGKRAGPSAFLTVQEGCDKFCSFCVVPYTRGSEVSRPAERIIAEARDLVAGGTAEITLLGQNVNAYHGEGRDGGWRLTRLIRELSGIRGLERIRYTTSHPSDMDDDLIAAHGNAEKLMPALHLPVQSGSDRMLKAMNRRHGRDDYLRTISKLRATRPDLALSSDFIVGFPGETDRDFEDTLSLCSEVGFAMAYSFSYSPRPGTPAAGKAEIPADIRSERLQALQALLTRQQTEIQRSMVGRRLPVLVEKPGREPGQMVGKTPWLHAVHFLAGPETAGKIVEVDITRSDKNTLAGTVAARQLAW